MTALASISLFHTLFVVYIVSLLGINLIALLISDFYQKKFDQPAPRLGFGAAVALGLLLIVSLFVGSRDVPLVRFVQVALLAGSAATSMYSSATLYFTMKRVRK
jgi:hypothetical protein